MTSILAWIAVFAVLIAVHELGHYLVAKALGMRVNEYSLGFGPPLLSARLGETLYAVRLIPLGGYVKLAGMDGGQPTSDPRDYPNRPLWQRFVVVLAGPVMNLVLAVILYAALFGPVGVPVPTTTVAATLAGYPAQHAGIRAGDRIIAVDRQPVANWTQLEQAIVHHQRGEIALTLVRQGQTQTVLLRTRYDSAAHQSIIGIQPAFRTVHQPWPAAVVSGVVRTAQLTGLWFQALANLVSGHGQFDVTGPVGIAVMVGQAARAGWAQLLLLAAALSANLGLFNILPIPVLDGSRLFLMGIEGIRRRAMDPERESLIHLVGFVVLLLFVVLVTYHDIVHYFHPGGSL